HCGVQLVLLFSCLAVESAYPSSGRDSGGVANEPGRGGVVVGTGLARDWARNPALGDAVGSDLLQRAVQVSDVGRVDLLGAGFSRNLVLVIVLVRHAGDGAWFAVLALVGEGRKSGSLGQRGDFSRTNDERWVRWIDWCRSALGALVQHTQLLGVIGDGAQVGLESFLDGRGVNGPVQAGIHGHLAVEARRRVLRLPFGAHGGRSTGQARGAPLGARHEDLLLGVDLVVHAVAFGQPAQGGVRL